jgi:hypothetical protein
VIELRSGSTALVVILGLGLVSVDVIGQYSGIGLITALYIVYVIKHGAHQIHETVV